MFPCDFHSPDSSLCSPSYPQRGLHTNPLIYDPNLGDLEISREKFNTLYTGIALIINGQAPVNATLLTDDEMRNIKALWHIAKIEHSYWVGGYWINVYLKVKVTVKIRYPYLKWVPGYLWKGWLPIPGHLEWRVGWYTKTVGMTIRVSRYIPRRKITYYTYKLVPDAPTGKYINISPSIKIIAGNLEYAAGSRLLAASVGTAILQPETAPIDYAGIIVGTGLIMGGTTNVINGVYELFNEPDYTNESYINQMKDVKTWF